MTKPSTREWRKGAPAGRAGRGINCKANTRNHNAHSGWNPRLKAAQPDHPDFDVLI